MYDYSSRPNAMEIDPNNPIAIRSYSALWPTWISPEEMYDNQIKQNPNFRVCDILDFPSMESLAASLWKSKNPILEKQIAQDDIKWSIEKLLSLSWWIPSRVHWKISYNGKALDDSDFILALKDSISNNSDLWHEFRENLLDNLKPSKKFDSSIIHSIYMSLEAVEKAWMLWTNWIIDKSSSITLWHGFAWLQNVENYWMMNWVFLWSKTAMWTKHLTWSLPNMPSSIVANFLRSKWGAPDVNTACAASWYAIETAIKKILLCVSDTVVTGWCDSMWKSLYALTAFWRMWALSRAYENNPNLSSRPFSKALEWATKWFTLWEWGWAFVLQPRDICIADWVKHSAEIVGIWTSNCNPLHQKWSGLSTWTVEWQALSMETALDSAWITAEEFVKEWGVVFAHWTATDLWDRVESKSIHSVFWDGVWVVAPKSITWHPLGWSAAQSISLAISSMKNSEIPWTFNYSSENAMEDLPDINIFWENKKGPVKYILVNAFWFWWHNVSILLKNPNA